MPRVKRSSASSTGLHGRVVSFGDRVWLASALSGTKIKHLSEVIQLCQPDVCQVTQFAGAAHPPGRVTARPEQYRVPGRWHFCQK